MKNYICNISAQDNDLFTISIKDEFIKDLPSHPDKTSDEIIELLNKINN